MSPAPRRPSLIEGRRGSRIDLQEGAAMCVSPETTPMRAFTTVQGTGCGTEESNRLSWTRHESASGQTLVTAS
jgi:hypothetical protein